MAGTRGDARKRRESVGEVLRDAHRLMWFRWALSLGLYPEEARPVVEATMVVTDGLTLGEPISPVIDRFLLRCEDALLR